MKRLLFCISAFTTLMLTGCDVCRREPSYPAFSIAKYKEGMDYSEYVRVLESSDHFDKDFSAPPPIQLHKNYYLEQFYPGHKFIGSRYDGAWYYRVYFLRIKWDEIESAPSDWKQHWKDYVFANDTVYLEYYQCIAADSPCDEGLDQFYTAPFRCPSCNYGIDTNILNRMIDKGTVYDYLTKRFTKR